MGLKELLSALSDRNKKEDLTKAEQEGMIRRIVLETLAEKSNTYEHNEILKRMLDVLECSVVQPTKQEDKKSTVNLEELNILIQNLTTKGSHSKEKMDEKKKSGQDKMILDLMLQLKEFNARNSSSSHADLDRSEHHTTTERKSRFDNDQHAGMAKQGSQNVCKKGGRGKSQTRQERPFGVLNPSQMGGSDQHQSSGGQPRALIPPGSYPYNCQAPSNQGAGILGEQPRGGNPRRDEYNHQTPNYRRDDYSQLPPSNRDKSWVGPPNHCQAPSYSGEQARGGSPRRDEYNHQAPNYRRGSPRRDYYSQPPPSNKDNSWVRTPNHCQAPSYSGEQARGGSPRRDEYHHQAPNSRGGQARGGNPRRGDYNYQAPTYRRDDYSQPPPSNRDKSWVGPSNPHSNDFNNLQGSNNIPEGFYNVVAGPIVKGPQNHQDSYQLNKGPNAYPRGYDNNHQMNQSQQDNAWKQNYQNVAPQQNQNNLQYQNPAQQQHYQNNVQTQHRANYGGNRGNYRGRGLLGPKPFGRGAGQMHSERGSMNNHRQSRPNMGNWVQDGSARNSNPCLDLTPGEITSIKNIIKKDTNAKGANKKNNETTFKSKKCKPTQRKSSADEDSDEDSEEESTKAEAVKTDENLEKKKRKKKKAETTKKEKTKNDSWVFITKGNNTGEAEVDSDTSQVETKSDTMTLKEVKSSSGVANAESESEPLKLFVASGYIVDLPEGVSLDQEIDDVVFMAKDEEGKIFSFQPKTVGKLAEFKKKYPNAQAIVVR